MDTKNIIIGVVVFVLLGFGAFAVLHTGNTTGGMASTTASSTQHSETGSTTTITGGNGVSVGVQGGNGVHVQQVPTLPEPDLDRPVHVTANLSAANKSSDVSHIASLSTSLKSDPNQLQAWNELGAYREAIGDIQGAEEVWNYVTSMWPNNAVAYNDLGNLYRYDTKEYQKSRQAFESAVQADPTFLDGYQSLNELYLSGNVSGGLAAAESMLLKGIAANPKAANLMVLLADDYKKDGKTSDARTYLQKALTVAQNAGNTSLAASIQEDLNALGG